MSLVFRETVSGGADGEFELIIKYADGSRIPAQNLHMGYKTYGPGYPEVETVIPEDGCPKPPSLGKALIKA